MRPPYKIGGLLSSISKACHCGAGVRWTPLRSRSTDRAGRRDRRKARGNPSFLLKGYGFFRAYHSCGAQKLFSLGARTTFDRGASFCSLFPAPQALATSLRMTSYLVIAKPCKRLWQSVLSPPCHCE